MAAVNPADETSPSDYVKCPTCGRQHYQCGCAQAEIPREKITYSYESDGEPTSRTFYIIAECDQWADPKRLDFTQAAKSKEICRRLRSGELSIDGAVRIAGRKWL